MVVQNARRRYGNNSVLVQINWSVVGQSVGHMNCVPEADITPKVVEVLNIF